MRIHQPSGADVILFGIQGSGKGTQGERLVRDHGMQQFVTGDALRSMARTDTEAGRRVKSYVESGRHAPDPVVMGAVGEAMKEMDPGTPILFDGMPRNETQKQLLDRILAELNRTAVAVHLVLDDETARERMRMRGRPDDLDPETVETRIRTFKEKTVPVIERFREEGRLVEVDAGLQRDAVYARIERVLGYARSAVSGGMPLRAAMDK